MTSEPLTNIQRHDDTLSTPFTVLRVLDIANLVASDSPFDNEGLLPFLRAKVREEGESKEAGLASLLVPGVTLASSSWDVQRAFMDKRDSLVLMPDLLGVAIEVKYQQDRQWRHRWFFGASYDNAWRAAVFDLSRQE